METIDDLPETHDKLTAKELARRKVEKKRDTEIDHAGNKVVTGHIVIGKSQIAAVTTHYPDGSTSVIYGTGSRLMRSRTGVWSMLYDFGSITDLAITSTLIGMKRRIRGGLVGDRKKEDLSEDDREQISRDTEIEAKQRHSTLRYWMVRVEAARRGDEAADRELWDFQRAGGAYSSEATAVIHEAMQLLEKVAYRDAESERLMDAVVRLASKHDRIPTMAEVGRFRAAPHARNEKATYSGRTYATTSKLQDRLKPAGIGWLPAGVRGEARSK
jgi:hypothetical protein